VTGPPPPPRLTRISDYLFHWAERRPGALAMALGEQRLTYAEASQQVRALSRALLASGVGKGDRVAMLCTPRPEFWLTFLACADLGAIWLGLNPRYTTRELRYVVDDSRPRLLLALTEWEGRDYRPDLAALAADRPELRLVTLGGPTANSTPFRDFATEGAALPDTDRLEAREAVGGRDPALIVYTSGTTGQPKGAMLTHVGLVYCFTTQYLRMAAAPFVGLCNLPINHVGCVGDLCCTPLVGGGAIHFMERVDPAGILRLVAREQITFLGQVPTIFQLLAALPEFPTADLSSLQLVSWGGAAMPRDLIELYRRRTAAKLMVVYGLTEGTGSITYSDVDADVDTLATTIGRPDPLLNVRLVAADGRPCGVGEEGEIQLRHDSVMAGYFNRPEATAEAFTADGHLRTGDVAVRRPDGYLRLVGRLKEMYKSGGYNVYPREIETCLESHPAVAMAAVIGVPDPTFQEVGHAFVLPHPGAAPDPAELTGWCRARLANYKVPKRITVAGTLPMLPVGKIDKQALKRHAAAAPGGP